MRDIHGLKWGNQWMIYGRVALDLQFSKNENFLKKIHWDSAGLPVAYTT